MDVSLKVSIQNLNFIFSHLASIDYKATWLRTPDYQGQIYISEGYEKIWGRPREQLYSHPKSWNETILSDEHQITAINLISKHVDKLDENNIGLYRVRDVNNRIRWVKDSCFRLYDNNHLVAVGGIAEEICQNQWEYELKQLQNNKKICACHQDDEIISSIMQELKLTKQSESAQNRFSSPEKFINQFLNSFGKETNVTKREAECLFHLFKGQTAKMIARFLNISPRTVEAHIDNLKRKFECRTRIELISLVTHNLVG